MRDLVLVGFGGHSKSLADTIERTGQFNIVGYTDVKEDTECSRYKYLGTDDALKDIYESSVKCAAIGVGYMDRQTIEEDRKDLSAHSEETLRRTLANQGYHRREH